MKGSEKMEATIKFKEFTVNVEEERKAYNSTRLTLAYDVKDTQIFQYI